MPSRPTNKFLFDLTADERYGRLLAVVLDAITEQKEHNLPIVYRNSMCISPNQFIHEYPDGKKFLIRQNRNNSEEKVIKQL